MIRFDCHQYSDKFQLISYFSNQLQTSINHIHHTLEYPIYYLLVIFNKNLLDNYLLVCCNLDNPIL